MFVELYCLAIVLTAIGDVAQVITGFTAQLLVLSTLGEVGQDALGLLHRVLVVIFLCGDTSLTHECSCEVELCFFASRIGLQGLAVLDLGLGIALFLIQLVAVAQAHSLLLGHLGSLVPSLCGQSDTHYHDSKQHYCYQMLIYLVESHCLR